MRLYYIDESKGRRYYVRSALGVDAESWNDLIAHSLLKQDEQPSPRACPILGTGVERQCIAQALGDLDRALTRRASRWGPQGVVRC